MLTLEEQETIVNFSRTDITCTIYTSDPTTMTKLDKNPTTYRLIKEDKCEGKIIAKTYEADKKMISFRSKQARKELTLEQKQAARDRMLKYQKSRKEN